VVRVADFYIFIRGIPKRLANNLPSFKRPCRYCSKLVTPEDAVCPYCGKESPIYIRCLKCRSVIQKDYAKCPGCGMPLRIYCVKCGKPTFFDIYCEACGQKQEIECPKCHTSQIPFPGQRCVKCKSELPLTIRPVV
jgi:RNA polymerase subunit RPABC4/transcription elongation factor Spt4